MTENVIRICDYERRSREPDAAQPRDPCEAAVIVLPVVRVEQFSELPCDVEPHWPAWDVG